MTAQSIPADQLLSAIREAGVQDIVLVPDTHQRTVLDLLMADDEIRTVHCSTEDEAVAVSAGLIIGGRRPMMQIQHAGLYASVNNLRGVGLEVTSRSCSDRLLGRDPDSSRKGWLLVVRLCRPLLETLKILRTPGRTRRPAPLRRAFDEAQNATGLSPCW